MSEHCPCGKEKPFNSCCGPLLYGDRVAKTPEQLMRSRYSAYVLGGHGKYLLETWFPATAQGLTEEQLSDRNVDWQKLEVLDKGQDGDSGSVEFKAYFREPGSKELKVLHEHSEFKRLAGRWYYVGGRV